MNTSEKEKPKPITWHDLQVVLRECTTEDEVAKLMKAEKEGPNRVRWLLRMQGRFRALRTDRENEEFLASHPEG